MVRARKRRRLLGLAVVMIMAAAVSIVAAGYITLLYVSPSLTVFLPAAGGTNKPKITEDRLYIPSIRVSVPIVEGQDQSALEKGAWHRKPENGNPKQGGNFVLSGHRFVMSYTPWQTAERSPFYSIDKVAIGDSIAVDYQGKRYEYTVARKFKVAPDFIALENRSSQPKLTLYSCTLRGSYDGRDVIEASPVF